MKQRVLISALVMLLVCGSAHAATMNWYTDGTFSSGIVDSSGNWNSGTMSSWDVWLYEDDDGTLPGSLDDLDNPTGGGSRVCLLNAYGADAVANPTIDGGTFGAVYNSSYDEAVLGLSKGDFIYSVVFNNADYASATAYAIVDNLAFTIPDYGVNPSFEYDMGSVVGGDWQAIPEPGTMALLGVGLGVVALRRKRK